MGIHAKCPACGHSMKLKAFLAGKRGICPKCQASFDIPSAPEGSDESVPQPRPVAAGAAANGSAAKPVARPSNVPARPASPHPAAAQAVPQATPRTAAPAQVAAPGAGAGYPSPTVPMQPAAVATATPGGYSPAVQPGGYTPAAPVQPTARIVATPVATPVAQPSYMGSMPVVSAAAPVAQLATPGMIDPLVEAPQAMWYVRPASGGQFGPAAADMMRQWLHEGRVAADSLVWRDGWADWQIAGNCFPQLAAASAPTATAGVEIISAGPKEITGRPKVYRRKSGGQVVLIVTLLIALLALIPLLVWVLSRNM